MRILTVIFIIFLQAEALGQVQFQQFFKCEDVKLMQESEHAMFIKKRALSPISVYEFLDVLQATTDQCRDSVFKLTLYLTKAQKAFLEDNKAIRVSPATITACRIDPELYYSAIYEYLLQTCITSQFATLDSLVNSISWTNLPEKRRSELAKAFYLVMADLYFDDNSFRQLTPYFDQKDSIYHWAQDWDLRLPSDWRKEIITYFRNGNIIEGNMLFYYYYWNRSRLLQSEWGKDEVDKEIEGAILNFGFGVTRHMLGNLNRYKLIADSDKGNWYTNLELNEPGEHESKGTVPKYLLFLSVSFWILLALIPIIKAKSLMRAIRKNEQEIEIVKAAKTVASKVGLPLALLLILLTHSKISQAQDSEKKFKTWDSLHQMFRDSSFVESFKYARAYFELAVELKDSMKIVKGGRLLTYSLMDVPDMERAIDILKNINLIVEDLKRRNKYPPDDLLSAQSAIFNNLGICYMHVGDFSSSMKAHLKSLEIKKLRRDTISIIRSISNIALNYHQFGIDKRADEIFKEGIYLVDEYKNKEVFKGTIILTYLYSNYALVKLELGELDKSVEYAVKGISSCDGLSYKHVNTAYLVYVNALISSGRKEEAREALKKVILQDEDVRQLGEYYSLKSELSDPRSDSCFYFIRKANEMSQKSDIAILRRISMNNLLKAYRNRGDSVNAMLVAKKLSHHNDSIFNQQLFRNIKWLDKSYMDVTRGSKRSKGEVLQLLVENYQIIIVNFAGAVIFILGYLFYRRIKNRYDNQVLIEQI